MSSYERTTTYYYCPKTNVLDRGYEYITVSRPTPGPTPVSTPPLTHLSTPDTSQPSTPQPKPATMARFPAVSFNPEVRASRRLRDDERAVCASWARHSAHCKYCCDPVAVWRRDSALCDRGRSYAIDVAKYIYSKGGRPHSVIDKQAFGTRTEIEIPIEYDAVRLLVKAFDKGLTLTSSRPVVSQDRTYYIEPRNNQYYEFADSRRERYHDDSHRRRRTVHFYPEEDYHGSLFVSDERARRERKRYNDEPIIIMANPRSSRYYR